jgi:integrase
MGTIRKLKSGRFNAQVRAKGHKAVSSTFDTVIEAESWVEQTEIRLGLANNYQGGLTFYELGIRYCKDVLAGRTSQRITIPRIEKLSKILPKTISEILPSHINAYRLKRLKEVRPVTVRDELQLINRIYRWAYKELIIDPDKVTNPCRNIPIPPGSKPSNKVVSVQELHLLMSALSPIMSTIVELAFETAMRRSEITKLKPRDLQLNERTLMVFDGKTGDRMVPLTKRAIEILSEAESRTASASDRLFPIAPHSVSTAVRRARRKLNMGEDIKLHQMRHTRITMVAKKGLNQPQIMMVSGHRDSRSVQRYTHLNVKDVIDLLD